MTELKIGYQVKYIGNIWQGMRGDFGTIIKLDNSYTPYYVKFNIGCYWFNEKDIELVNKNKENELNDEV